MSESTEWRIEPSQRAPPPDASELRPAAATGKTGLKAFLALTLAIASTAMAVFSALVGLLAVALGGAAVGSAAGSDFEFKTWAAIALGQFILGALTLWRAPRRFGPDWRTALGLRSIGFDRGLAKRTALALVVYWCWTVLVFVLAESSGAMRSVAPITRDGAAFAMAALTTVVAAPICEELFFRGYVQGRAREFLPPSLSIAFPAVLFAAAHFRGEFAQPAAVFMLGILAGRLRRETGSLLPGMALHAISNGGIVVLLALAR